MTVSPANSPEVLRRRKISTASRDSARLFQRALKRNGDARVDDTDMSVCSIDPGTTRVMKIDS